MDEICYMCSLRMWGAMKKPNINDMDEIDPIFNDMDEINQIIILFHNLILFYFRNKINMTQKQYISLFFLFLFSNSLD